MIKALVFDCYGVILGQGFKHTYYLAGGDPNKDAGFIKSALNKANIGQISNSEFVQLMINKLGIDINTWWSATYKGEQADERLLSYIKNKRENYKTAILSNANIGSLRQSFGDKKLADYFDEVVVSADVGLIKPDPDIFLLTAKRLKLKPSEILFTDDNQANLNSARDLRMKTILYKGYDDFISQSSKILS